MPSSLDLLRNPLPTAAVGGEPEAAGPLTPGVLVGAGAIALGLAILFTIGKDKSAEREAEQARADRDYSLRYDPLKREMNSLRLLNTTQDGYDYRQNW